MKKSRQTLIQDDQGEQSGKHQLEAENQHSGIRVGLLLGPSLNEKRYGRSENTQHDKIEYL
ncbi:MAG: hypothetical protein JW896_02460 [Deltaproteobacteria bacterium]|nr:hypothetical protein [Deltaproteobacteria bacterium]